MKILYSEANKVSEITSEEFSVLQQQVESLSKDVTTLKDSVTPIVEYISKAAKEKEEETKKQKKDEDENKMFKRFARMLKEEGVVFARKQKVETAPGQTSVTPEKKPESQQAVIQGQERRRGDEYAGEYPEAKAEEKPEYEEEKAKKPEEEEKAEKPEYEEEKAKEPCEEEKKAKPEEYPEAAKKEIATLRSQLESLTASIPKQVEKAINKRMQELGWKTIGKAPVRGAGAEEVMLLKSDQPISREELIKKLKELPLSQLNDMHQRALAGEILLPEVK